MLNVKSAFWNTLLASLFAVTLVSTLALSTHAYGDDDDDDDDDDDAAMEEISTEYTEEEWLTVEKPRIEAIFNAEKNRLFTAIDNEITRPRTVELVKLNIRKRLNDRILGNFSMLRVPGVEISWTDFDRAPTKSKDEIVAEVERKARDLAEKEVQPEARKARVADDAEELYTMYKIGERVTLTLRGGRGANAIIEDKPFMGLNEEVVQIGNRLIIRSDLDPLDLARFYSDINEEAKANYILVEKGKIQIEYDSMVDEYVQRNTPIMLRECGYVPDINHKFASLRTAKTQYWIPKRDLITNVRKKLIDLAQERVLRVKLPEYMRQQGFILYPALNGSGEEWISEKEKERREAPPPAADPNEMMYGDPSMMMGPPPGMR